jgi:hypothetical protein
MKPWKIYIAIAAFVITLGLGVYAGYRMFHASTASEAKITPQVILTALRDRGFLVTQTFVFDEPVTIDKSSGSAFKDFFFGQTIMARGTMEVNMGIDLAKVSESDVTIDANKVTVTIPGASVFNVRLVGPLDVKNSQGILKRLLENDDGYNEAQAELSRVAEEAAKKPELIQRANDNAVSEVTRLLGYVAQGKTVEIKTKP